MQIHTTLPVFPNFSYHTCNIATVSPVITRIARIRIQPQIAMTEVSEETQRIREQVTSLSTQLIESIERQSQLEEKLNQAGRVINSNKDSVAKLATLQQDHDALKAELTTKKNKIEELKASLESETKLRTDAEAEVEKLSHEVEDLTATLFDEANNMVADARKETHNTEVRNTKLIEQLKDKDNMLETMTLQLKNLKKVLQDIEKESSTNRSSRYSVVLNESDNGSGKSLNRVSTAGSLQPKEQENVILYSPNVTAIRYDLSLFNEFLKFIAVLPYCKSIRESASESKLLRRLVNDEIQPVLRIDNAPGIGWLAKKSLLQQMIDGLVVLEPLSGVNETYQMGYRTASGTTPQLNKADPNGKESHLFNYPANSPPVAVHGPCALCGENRDDIIEHARMHVLKVQSKAEDGTLSVTNSYSLCFCCVNKVRQTCQVFAFLRTLKLGTWHLERVTLKNIEKGDWSKVGNVKKVGKPPGALDKKSKRMSFMEGLGMAPQKSAPQMETSEAVIERAGFPTTNIQRAWLHLCQLRSMLFWSHIGVWATDDSVSGKIGPVIKSKDDEVSEPQTPSEQNDWKPASIEVSLDSHHDVDAGDDEFDFESKSDLGEESEKDEAGEEKSIPTVAENANIEEANDETFTREDTDKPAETETTNEKSVQNPDSTEDSATADSTAEDEDVNATENSEPVEPHSTEEKVESDEQSIDILNDYGENEHSKEGTVSSSNDDFDDAKDEIGETK